ncbi:MAG TPA: branched-chain amino acid ABC transporter permease [Candidatus Angelobacter sp.]|jgi:branched-chain amino acid transport system permease protein|nr:branched-chain amino acid ABC transporter permease [Candidatus Angelobacter sp.]
MQTVILYFLLSLPLVGAYALLGLGITVIYQASRVLNLAHGAMAMGAAYATYQFDRWHVPLLAAVAGGIVVGALLGLLIERVFVRRLRSAGPTVQTVGTVAALTFAIAIAARIWGSLPVVTPNLLPTGALHFADGFVPWRQIGIFPIALAGAAILFALFQFTDLGLAMRGAAQNRRGAALRGVDPDRTAAFAWILGGAFAGLAGILLAGANELDPYSVSLGVLPAFVAALIGGLESMPGVCLGALIVGVVQGMVPALAQVRGVGSVFQGQGSPELILSLVALVVMAMRGARLVMTDVRADTL